MIESKRLFDYDPITGITEYFIYDDSTGGFAIEYQQDAEPLVEANKALWNTHEKHSKYGEWSRVASIPNVVVMELAKQKIMTPGGTILDDKKFRAFLNDRENQYLRTRPGRI